MPFCSQCGNQVGGRDIFCAKCGFRQPVEAPRPAADPLASITLSGQTVEVARDAQNAWALTQPVKAPAEQGAAEAAASQVTTMRILDTIPEVDPKVVGLEVPEYVLTIKFTGGGERTVDLGVITPTESGYYVRNAAGQVVIVSRDAIDPLLGLLDNPPYAQTPTPGVIPATETATP
jgi:hypothetical protein